MSGAAGTISAVELEPPAPDADSSDRIHRMSAELRRFTADRQRRRREFHQQLASAHYRSVRANLLLSVLTRARAGTLSTNWRDSLALRPTEHPAAAMFSSGDHLAVREVADTPPSAWEPHSGAGWRRALETWFDATNDVYTALEQVWLETEQANRIRMNDQREAARRLRSHLGWAKPEPRISPPSVTDFPHSAPRLHIEAWYRAGLAGGGEDTDWVDWLRAQDNEASHTLLDRLSDPDNRWQIEHLPDYWGPPARTP